MGKVTGFMEIERKETPERSVAERTKDFAPIQVPAELTELQQQGARCMDCGVPFCQAGEQVAGTSIGCPLGNPIPETNDLVYRGHWNEAFRQLSLTHPFPEITGRVCPALCEGSCVEGSFSDPVAIKSIERSIADYGLAAGITDMSCAPSSGKSIAVIGSGPSGLACASALAKLGHEVTVFEKQDRPGGFLMYGIPNMKLEKSLLDQRVELLKQQGVVFKLNSEVGRDIEAAVIRDEFNAMVLCIGARKPRELNISGSDALGVHSAVAYLTEATKALLEERPPKASLSAEGKEVVVVGGGDTGTDCIATALRQDAASIAALEIMPMLPKQRGRDNPWPLWPRLFKTDYGHKEAYERYGRDVREYETTVKEFLTDGKKVTGLTTVKVEWKQSASGTLVPFEIPGTEKTRKADFVVVAMGFSGVEADVPMHMGLELSPRNNIATVSLSATDKESFATSIPGVFVAGDARRGPSLVVWALREGLKAAACCHEYVASGLVGRHIA